MDFMNLAIEMANKSNILNETPVGAVLVFNDQVISKGYNTREYDNNILSHAEINCILEAAAKLATWKLNSCDIYVTLKPCSICDSVIKQSRIRNVFYLVDKPSDKKEYYKTKFVKYNNDKLEEEYLKLLKIFFNKKR